MPINRRKIFTMGGVALAAAAGVGGVAANANAKTGSSGSLPESAKFNLKSKSDRLFWKKPLHNGTIMQCFAFDNTNEQLYVMQRTDGTATTDGHLTITRLTFTGEITGHMYLKAFGHGIAFGVQPNGSDITMWTEADSQSSNGSSARARVVCRFAWKDGATVTKDDVELYEPIKDMYSASCSLDLEHNTIAVRCTVPDDDHMTTSLYDLDEFADKKFDNVLARVRPGIINTPGVSPQGYQQYGQHLYQIQGNAYDAPCDQENKDGSLEGNTKVSRINFNDESDNESHLTKAGYSLSYREPEGIGLVNVDGKPRLAMGFASSCPPKRLCNIYYKHDPAA